MFLCVCNAITDRQVRQLAETGVTAASEVHQALGCAPQCAKCIPSIERTLREARAAARSGGDCGPLSAYSAAE